MLRAREPPAKICVLEPFELDLERVEHREVAVHDRVHQRVEHEARAVAQQLRLALAARAHARRSRARLRLRTDST